MSRVGPVRRSLCLWAVGMSASLVSAAAEPIFIEAENFTVAGDGWRVDRSRTVREASRATALNGAAGDGTSVASHTLRIPAPGTWRCWVRYAAHPASRGPFDVAVLKHEDVVASHTFDLVAPDARKRGNAYQWESFDADLAPGHYTIRLAKHRGKNASWVTRHVDCFFITDDLERRPDHVPYGPQTWMRVTLGTGYEKPVQIHVFADHFRAPWYAHYAVGKDGVEDGLNPKRPDARLSDGDTTGWVNISRMVYQDSGAILRIYPAQTYTAPNQPRFDAVIEFATAPAAAAVVKRFDVDYEPATIRIAVPPNLETPEHVSRLRADREFAEEIGAVADSYDWPTVGRKPVTFPFFVSAALNPSAIDEKVLARELRTLSYFGFNGLGNAKVFEKHGYAHKSIGNVGWYKKGSYSAPDLEKMEARAPAVFTQQREAGVEPERIAFAMVMDEPTGEPAAKLADDQPSITGFRAWLAGKNLAPSDMGVGSWDEVKPVVETRRHAAPALHYYTQQYRTVALGNYIALQKQLLHDHWKTDFPVVVNFSDGAIYYANFYGQGVDYFTLLHETDQNAIWSEDWSNGASTYQCASFNVDLMRGAARRNEQWMGHHLIAYAGRKAYDIRLKAVSEVARGVRAFESFAYGPIWATHEGNPWQKQPSLWGDHATVVREIGAVEDLLMPATPRPADVALLYSSATDIWTLGDTSAYGFDRMHTWLTLAHGQVPVDVVHEREIPAGVLDHYKVAYLSGPNLTRAAAERLAAWVKAGGTLVMTAGAAQQDEFNRPLDALDRLLSFNRQPAQCLQVHGSSGRQLVNLKPQDTVKCEAGTLHVLAVKQTFTDVHPDGDAVSIEATFSDGTPAAVRSSVGQGRIIAFGYLPALDYIHQALSAKGVVAELKKDMDDNNGIPGPDDVMPLELHEKSYNPWEYPADVRAHILAPAHAAALDLPIRCSVPLVDAMYLQSEQGIVIPLANYTLQPIESMSLEIAVERPINEVRSVHQGRLDYEAVGNGRIRVQLPLDCTDFLTIR